MLLTITASHAANVSLTAADAVGTSSFNSSGKWSVAAAPNAANDYYTSAYFLRTPSVAGNYTFAGNSLTLQQPTSSGVRSVIHKGGNGDTFTINNLTNAFGGIFENGGSGNVGITITGNQWTIAGNSAIMGNQGWITVNSPLASASGIILTNGGGNANGITYNGNNSAFKGIFYISPVNFGNGGNNTRVILNAANSQPGNPTSLTPNQIWITAGSTLQDNVGLLFTNSNGGFLLNGSGTATINVAGTTLIGEPITDVTNSVSSVCSLTLTGAGSLILSNANNNYSGGTIISAGTLRMGVVNALPGNTVGGNVTVTGTLDLNGNNTAINGLNGAGTVDNTAAGAATLTVGANGNSGSFTGTLQNSAGSLSLAKVGAGTETLSGFNYSGNTIIAGGTLNLSTAGSLPSTPGSVIVSNAVLNLNAASGTALPASNVTISTNGTINLTVLPTAASINASGNLTLLDNSTNNFNFGTLTSGNPTAPAINVAGGIVAPASVTVFNIAATGLKSGTFTLIKYGTGTLASIANFQLNPPPGVAAVLVNNTGNQSLDVQITSTPNLLAWNGANGTSWDLGTANWTNITSGGLALFQQYTNGSVVAGDSVILDDTLTNDFVNPQPTNLVLNTSLFAFPVLFNSTLPYSIAGTGGIKGVTSLTVSNTGSLTLLTSNSYTRATLIGSGTLIVTNDKALGSVSSAVTFTGGTLEFAAGTTSTRPMSLPATGTIDVLTNVTAQLNGAFSGAGNLTKTDNGTLALGGNNSVSGLLQINGGAVNITGGTSTFAGNPSLIGFENGNAALNVNAGTLNLAGELRVGDTDISGTGYTAAGTANLNGGNINASSLTLVRGNNFQNGVTGTMTVNSGSTFISTNDVILGYAGTGHAQLNLNGGTFHVGTTAIKWLIIPFYDTTTGELDITNGTLKLNAGSSIKFSRGNTSTAGSPNVINQESGAVTFYSDYATTVGGGGAVDMQYSGAATITNVYNLDGGILTTPQIIASLTTATRYFNFNGGTLKAAGASAAFLNAGVVTAANVRNGGAIIDTTNFNLTISQPLVHSILAGDNATDGGLTKKGTGTLTLSGANTYTGATTNNAGTLTVSGAFTNASGVFVNGGVVQFTGPILLQGPTVVSNTATLGLTQLGSTQVTISNLTLNGTASGGGALLSLTPGSGYNSTVPMASCGTLTLNGTNSIALAAANLGVNALVKYFALAGTGNCTNLTLPQGASGFISNSVANSTLYAVITSTGPGLVWTGTNGAAANLWDLNNTTNWLVNSTPTSYHQIISPGDSVTFNDIGSGTVTLNSLAAPASLVISNNSKNYTFSGTGSLGGSTGILKQGTGTVALNLTNNNYSGSTTINGGSVQLGNASALPAAGSLIVGAGGTLKLNGYSLTASELTGAGVVDDNSGNTAILTIGSSTGGTWNGSITNSGGGGVALNKNGSGTWVVGGNNYLNDGQSFGDVDQLNQGTTVITNGGLLNIAYLQTQIASGAGQNGAVVVAGGTLIVTNNVLSVGYGSATANGTLTVNSGTVDHSGYASSAFAAVANSIDVGAQGATGTLIVNGGQVLNDQPLFLGDGTGANGTLYLNGGSLRSSVLQANGTPTTSVAYFNGGTLKAATNTVDFLLVSSMVMSNGLVLDDNGFNVTISSQPLQAGDAFNGGLIKKGSGAVYLDSGNTFTGTTLVTNGLLSGVGSVAGPVVVAPTGSLGAGDASGNGTFTINNNLTIQGASFMRINKTGGTPAQDQVVVTGNATYGGVLNISNITSDATVLVVGDTFQLFNVTGTKTGNFSSIVGSPGSGLTYSFNPASGVLSVANGVANYSTNITATVTGTSLNITWPSTHLGWILQSQTNSLSTGLNSSWFDVGGTSTSTSANFTIDPAKPTVFFRLRHP